MGCKVKIFLFIMTILFSIVQTLEVQEKFECIASHFSSFGHIIPNPIPRGWVKKSDYPFIIPNPIPRG